MVITRKLSVGGYLNYISSKISYGSLSSDLSIVGIGVTMKLSFEITAQMSLRAGIGIGYQMTEAADIGEYGEDITGFDLAPITELTVKSETGLTYLVSIAGFSQPAGGNEEQTSNGHPFSFSVAAFNLVDDRIGTEPTLHSRTIGGRPCLGSVPHDWASLACTE